MTLPTYSDLDAGHVPTVSFGPLANYVSWNSGSSTLTFAPTNNADIDVTISFDIYLSDSNAISTYTVSILVLNDAPLYDSPPSYPALVTVPLNSVKIIPSTSYTDPNGAACTILIEEVSKTTATVNVIAYYDQLANNIIIAPVGFTEVGDHILDLVLWDYSLGTSGRTTI